MLKEIMEIKSNDGERKTGKGEEDGKGGGGRERGRGYWGVIKGK